MSELLLKTEQFEHQREIYLKHREDPYFALFWEMGLGKTKVMLDVAAHLFQKNIIETLLIIAPNSVYKNWLSQEIPAHLAVEYIGMSYPKSNTEKSDLKKLLFLDQRFQPGKLRIMCISYNSVITEHGQEFCQNILTVYKTMVVADESTAIKTHSAKQTKAVKKIGKNSYIRWIATGTPAAQSPFDLHSQIEFLNEDFWGVYGVKTYSAFKTQFGEFNWRVERGRRFQEVTGYRNLNTLKKIIEPISSRLLKEDSVVKLPPKTYSVWNFELTTKQRRLYDQLKREFQAELDNGMYLEAPLAIVRLARLQQITSGFVTAEQYSDQMDLEFDEYLDLPQPLCPSKKKLVDIIPPSENPRLLLLLELLEQCSSHKAIVWCRYRRDVDIIVQTLGERAVRYDGAVDQSLRETALKRFRDPNDPARVFVANTQAISQGVTLTIAKTMIYYSNSFSLEKRLQSEDRNHRIGQDSSVLVIDIAAEESVDLRIIESLKNKFEIAAQVTGDRFREWIK